MSYNLIIGGWIFWALALILFFFEKTDAHFSWFLGGLSFTCWIVAIASEEIIRRIEDNK